MFDFKHPLAPQLGMQATMVEFVLLLIVIVTFLILLGMVHLFLRAYMDAVSAR